MRILGFCNSLVIKNQSGEKLANWKVIALQGKLQIFWDCRLGEMDTHARPRCSVLGRYVSKRNLFRALTNNKVKKHQKLLVHR